MNTHFYFKKFKQLSSLLFLFFLFTTNFSAQPTNCQGYTLTQGGWGAPNLDNPHVSYMYDNFNKAFPGGLTLGCATGYQLKLTSPAAVTDFLPSGGTSSTLGANYTNPGTSYSNTLAAQLVSVMLAVQFDSYDANFSSPTVTLGEYVLMSGPFAGKTVNQFLEMANNFMGGCGTSAYSATQFNEAATAINENYDEGNRDLGYLKCCMLEIQVNYDAIKCFGSTTMVHVTATGGSSATTGRGDFAKGAGTYTFTVTDGSCSASKTVTITQPDKLDINVSATPISCFGGNSTVTVTATGGTGSYTGIGTFTVKAGTYSYTVKDENGCEATKSITISEPTQLVVDVQATPISCNGGDATVTVTATGGTGSYTGTGTFTVKAGTYSYTVRDANGCEASKSITISEPDAIVMDVQATPISCNGGDATVTVTATGGTGAFTGTGTFTVKAGTYSYTVKDENGCEATKSITISEPRPIMVDIQATPIACNGGDATVTVTATGGTGAFTGTGTFTVKAGTYSYTVKDENGCEATKSITINEPTPLSLRLTITEVPCSSSANNVSVAASGGTPMYTYLWSNGETGSSAKLPAGPFTVTVTDANGCTATASGTVKAIDCGKFTTVTQGGWGAKAAGKNWGAYRDQYFSGAFPTGLTVGAGTKWLKLTSAKAVEDFLPSGSTPRALNPGTMTNPGAYYSNVLAGQTVALTLNIRFDEYVASFSPSAKKLGDMIVVSGTFAGWSVYQVLAEANKALGGMSTFSAAEINGMVDGINNNYDGGKVDNGLLTCPCPDASKTVVASAAVVTPELPKVASEVTLYPNPSNGEFNIKFDADRNSTVVVQVFDFGGKMMADYSNKVVRNGNKASVSASNYMLPGGVYIVKVKTSTMEKTLKLIIKK
ncbi:Por secretion system C-terminal sorting domain-containing protein [Kaistella treverensis]|uniref:Por secretion system C-terminal sorting domain-containing protein n=1 Tax=Kaistella treverensis TaxID=631455 RepID=A0A1I3N3H4_9FLAO|nr:T9SS type A sorting domain-containing protein [Kaistella treverensis]SFJ03904.1 Por secretion system C-terminal sorting domain-containing protein [Kaistella treverensis]